MQRILCPTDFSPVADNALVFAAKLCKRMDATLYLAYIQRLADLTSEKPGDLSPDAGHEAINARCHEVSEMFQITCYGEDTSLQQSIPVERFGVAPTYDLVVIGTNGSNEFAQHLLGSKTYHLINKIKIPVLAVPEGCTYRDMRTIVYAFDYWRSDEMVLAQVVSLAETLRCKLIILQVTMFSFSTRAEAEVKQLQSLILETYSERVPISFALVHDNQTSDAIDNFLAQGAADMLVICAQHQGFPAGLFHKSVMRAITDTASYPVLVFHR